MTGLGEVTWAVRVAIRRPAATATIVGTLALAVAAATLAFSVARATLWKPLPFRDASRLVLLWETPEASGGGDPQRVTSGRYLEWRDHARAFSSMAAFGAAGFIVDDPSGAVQARGVRVTGRYFETLGVTPILGRGLTVDDEEPGRQRVVVLSHAWWRQRFGGRTDVVGETVRFGGEPYTIVGVMGPAVFPGWPVNPARVTLDDDLRQFWVPIARTPQFEGNSRSHLFGVVARLADGASMAEARTELSPLASSADPHGGMATPLREQFVREARTPLLTLLAAAVAVLLVACANLAALQATLVEARRVELGMRLALGAGASRVARQLLMESLLLAGAGGAIGVLIARAGVRMVPGLLPTSVPLLTVPAVDAAVLLFAFGAALLAGALMAAWPLAKLRSVSESPRGIALRPRPTVYRALVVAEIAATVALTITAGLLARSLWTVRDRDPGFVIAGVATADVSMAGSPTARQAVDFERRVLRRVEALAPGVRAAAAYDQPLEANWTDAYTLVGDTSDQPGSAQLRIVSPGYVEAMGVSVVEGRAFTERDDLDAPGVALVNEAFARTLPEGVAIGRRIRASAPRATWGDEASAEYTVVGVVEDERMRGLEEAAPPAYYLSTRQFPQQGFTLVARAEPAAEVAALVSGLRPALREVDPGASVLAPRTLQSILDEQLVTRSLTTRLVGGFSGAALFLAVLGVYGLLAVVVAGQAREIGVRLALGAEPSRVGRAVVVDSFVNGAVGVAAGMVLAVAAGRAVQGLLVGVTAMDPLTMTLVAALMLSASVAAAVVPAWRAARVDPAVTLRGD